MRGAELRSLRTDLQMVFQDPHAALNPSMTIEEAVGHPLVIHGIAKGAELHSRVEQALERVGLSPTERFLTKYPSDLSGGQKQRAVIARAIILDPEVLVADEPVSMLDMSVRAKILQLMLDLRRDLGLTYVYITHDLATAKYFCDRVAIMYLGKVVEIGPTAEIFASPRHPYTKALLAAIPEPDPEKMMPRNLPRGEIPDAAEPPLGCSFHPRCPEAVAECGWESRDLRALIEQHWTREDASYDEEQGVLGDLSPLDEASVDATVGKGGNVAVQDILDRIKGEDPEEPLWRGVRSMEPEGAGVTVHFQEADSPALRRAGNVDVACVLYPDEGARS
jgi:peptide/nickel transport system ATP-binding protein